MGSLGVFSPEGGEMTSANHSERQTTQYLRVGDWVRPARCKLSGFGSFKVRKKRQRIGRNLKTVTEVPIAPRGVMLFKTSVILKQRIKGRSSDA
jgi:Bacterial DNA-binding protein